MKYSIITRSIIALCAALAICLASPSPAGARQPSRGYRGFAEFAATMHREPNLLSDGRHTQLWCGASTSHGFQFNPNLFIGAGLSMEKVHDENNWIMPLFIQARTDQRWGRFTPFGDIRLGYNIASGGDLYISPTIGYRLNWGRKMGVNLGLGISILGEHGDKYSEPYVNEFGWWDADKIGTFHKANVLFTFRLGIDF